MRHVASVLDGVVLGQKPAKTAAADDDLLVVTGKVSPQPLDIVDNLVKSVGLGAGALAVASKVEREHSQRT